MSWTRFFSGLLLWGAVVGSCGLPGLALAADDDDDRDVANGLGSMFRMGVIEGQGIPQDRSLAPLEAFPYILDEDSLFFSDLRFFPALNNLNYPARTTFGGNVGLGYRYYSEGYDRVFGASIWYDADNTRKLYFQQLGLSLETYGELIDVRSNFYLPVGPLTQQSSLTLVDGSTQFNGNYVSYDLLRTWAVAMKGFDAELGLSVPWGWARDMGLRVYGGGYHYADDQSDSITGGSARIVANIFSGLDAQVQVTHDNFYQTRAFVGLSWTFGPLHFSKLSQETAYGRMGEHITRNYTVVAPERSRVEYVPAAINPATGTPWTFSHVVSGAASGGNGSVNSPYATIAAAQAANRNIIFVHSNSVFTGSGASVVLNPGNVILGDGSGVQNFIPVPTLGSLLLPQASASSSLPVLSGAAGDAVVLASNTTFSGFSINNAGGNAVLGTGVGNVSLKNLFINTPTSDGVRLVNSSGPISLVGTAVNSPLGSGIDVIGGTGPIAFSGFTNVVGAHGPAVSISGVASGGSVIFGDLNINQRQDLGLSIDNTAGTVAVNGTLGISNNTSNPVAASAIDIRNSSGKFNFNTVNASTPSTMALTGNSPTVNLQNDTGTTTFQTLNINTTNATALRANNAGLLVINPADANNNVNLLHGGTIVAIGGTALDFQNTALNINFQSVSSSNAPVGSYGISLINTTGLLGVFGSGSAGSGGVIQGASSGGIYLQNAGTTGFQSMVLNNNLYGIHADTVSSLYLSNSTVSNSGTYGVGLTNTPMLILLNDTFTGNGAANVSALFSASGGTYGYTISNTQFTSTTADNLDFTGSGSALNLSLQNNLYNNSAIGSAGVNVNWSGALTAQINQSSFVETGNNITGVLINNTSNAMSNISFTNNAYSTTGSGGTGFHFIGQGTSVVTATNNLIQFGSTGGTGFEMSLVGPTVNLANNKISDTVDGTTGMLFDSVTGPGVIAINGNTITLANLGGLLDRGIIFSNVPTSFQLQGSVSNTITGADTPFFVPANTTTGSILVNGAVKP